MTELEFLMELRRDIYMLRPGTLYASTTTQLLYKIDKKIKSLKVTYYCDDSRHLVCKPYSIKNLHRMAEDLNIKRGWFHKNHYDIPKLRIDEIKSKCRVVNSREIVRIIRDDK